MAEARYIPAAGHRSLNFLYDPLLALTMRERKFRPALVARVVQSRPGTVLDLGCGTGTLTTMIARALPTVRCTAVDGDRWALDRAGAKAERAGVQVELVEALADDLPIASSSQDVVVSSLLFHHLAVESKQAALTEALRVVRPGGHLFVADWGRPQDLLARAGFYGVQVLDGFGTTRAHAQGRLPGLIAAAGFDSTTVFERFRTVWGTLELIEAAKSGE